MKTFVITDRSRTESTTEKFLNNSVAIKSHSGLHSTECNLIENLTSLTTCKSLLIAGNRTGAAAMIASTLHPECAITCHAQDIHHASIIYRNLNNNSLPVSFLCDDYVKLANNYFETEPQQFTVACTTQIPDRQFDNALFMNTPSTVTGEQCLDLLENIHKVLKVNGKCIVAYEGESHTFNKNLKSVFAQVHTVQQNRKGSIFIATKKAELKKPRNFAATFETSLPGTGKIELVSLPGVFCHRRADNGGLALAEVAAPLLESKMRVLDMGCGCGIVGILLSQKQPDIELTFIDSSARALDATNRNIQSHSTPSAELILSDNGTKEIGYDLFAGNPPYYSDYRIAECFIEQAYNSLKVGGTALIVTKQSAKVGDLIYEKFENAEITPRRGYSVISAERQS